MKGNKICGAIILTRAGFEEVSADMVIDCTGDGDVGAAAGAPVEIGYENSGKCQPATLFFRINNVDSARLEADVQKHLHEFRRVDGVSYRALHWWVAKAEEAGEWDIARKSVNIYKCVKDDEWAVNCVRVKGVDALSSESLSASLVEGRRQIEELMNFFHKYVPGCENATIKSVASAMGIRESRHIMGEAVCDAHDFLTCKVPEDAIFLASNSVDLHGGPGENATKYMTIEGGNYYGVPYGCLVPKNVENLLVAGRPISATSDAIAAIRVMPPCMAMGQAAGIAAALCIKGGLTPRTLDYAQLKSELIKDGVFFG